MSLYYDLGSCRLPVIGQFEQVTVLLIDDHTTWSDRDISSGARRVPVREADRSRPAWAEQVGVQAGWLVTAGEHWL